MKKDPIISWIRLVSMLMIVFCHIAQGLGSNISLWLNLGVQVFLFMSGYLYGNRKSIKNYFVWYKRQFIKIILPVSIFTIVMLFAEYILLDISYSPRQIIGNLIGLQAFVGNLQNTSHLWFISYILICYLITPFLYKINWAKSEKYCISRLALFALALFAIEFFGVVPITGAWIWCYVAGFAFSTLYQSTVNIKTRFTQTLGVLLIIFIPLKIMFRTNPEIFTPKLGIFIETYSHAFLSVTLFVALYLLFKLLHRRSLTNLLAITDKYSFPFYVAHQIFILGSFSLLFNTQNILTNILVIFIVVSACAYALERICFVISKIKLKRIISRVAIFS